MEIKSSLEWLDVGAELTRQINRLPYNHDLRVLIHNIDIMVTNLSKLEVEARRVRKSYLIEEKIAEINSAIDRLEKLLLIAKLIS